MSNFIVEYENAVPEELCNSIIDEFLKIERISSSWKGEDSNNGLNNRKDFSIMLELHEVDMSAKLNGYLDTYLSKYMDEFPSLGMRNFYSNEIKVQRTPPKGGFHVWHCEHASGDNAEKRVLAWTVYLSDVPDGEGETEFLEFGVKIKPKKGSICFFPAAWTHTHRGNPVYSCEKFIATGWYYLN